MASRRSDAKRMARRMAAIEENQRLIMVALGISVVDEDDAAEDEVPQAPEEPVDYDAMTVADLEEEAVRRGIYDDITGTGKDGNVVKADLITALVADDEASGE